MTGTYLDFLTFEAANKVSHATASGENWKTINGAHVLIGKDGRIEKGPKHLVGKTPSEVSSHGKAAPKEKEKPGYHRIERNAVGGYVGTHTDEGVKHVPEHESRLKSHGISPGYDKIHLAKDPMAMLQVYQTDAAGREGRIYSDEHHEKQKKLKHARVDAFRKILPELEKSIANDPSEEAAVLRLIRPTGIRQGSETDTKAKQQAYGATTMRSEHVLHENGKTVLHFIGKDGVQNHIAIDDESVANELKSRAKRGGKLYNTNEKKVRAHLDKLAPGFLVKDLRTVVANETAEKEIRSIPVPKTLPDLVKARMEVATRVAKKLGNTPVIALGEYINPERFSKWETSAANNEQASAIERYAENKKIPIESAAREWIAQHAKAFRENFNQRLASPKKVKAYDDGTGQEKRGKREPAMAAGGRDFEGAGRGDGPDELRWSSLHDGRYSLGGGNRGHVGRMTSGEAEYVFGNWLDLIEFSNPNQPRNAVGEWTREGGTPALTGLSKSSMNVPASGVFGNGMGLNGKVHPAHHQLARAHAIELRKEADHLEKMAPSLSIHYGKKARDKAKAMRATAQSIDDQIKAMESPKEPEPAVDDDDLLDFSKLLDQQEDTPKPYSTPENRAGKDSQGRIHRAYHDLGTGIGHWKNKEESGHYPAWRKRRDAIAQANGIDIVNVKLRDLKTGGNITDPLHERRAPIGGKTVGDTHYPGGRIIPVQPKTGGEAYETRLTIQNTYLAF